LSSTTEFDATAKPWRAAFELREAAPHSGALKIQNLNFELALILIGSMDKTQE
jgi:hypothetical protein